MLSLPAPIWATHYYVDFAGGNDSHAGTSTASAWKHAPGDVLASGTAAAATLVAGDTVLFKGGVLYRGQIRNAFSGTAGQPITFKGDGWPGLTGIKAIIDGTDVYPGAWTRCASAADCGGNPNWQNIYYSSFSGIISPFTQFFENGERVYIAQTPNISDPFWDDKFDEYLPVTPQNITRTSIRDDSFLTQSDSHHWDGAYIQVWVNPNVISIRKVTGFNPATHTIYYETLSPEALYGDRNQYYSLVNQIHTLDRVGEYVVDETAKKIYYWPHGSAASMELSVSNRAYGLCTRGRSNLVIDGFILQGFSHDTTASAIVDDWISQRGTGLLIKNNEVRWTRSRDGRTGSISLNYTDGVTIQNNSIHHCQRNSGILIGTNDIIVQDNQITQVGYKGLWFMGVRRARVLRNQISDCSGTHGNPMSVFTTEDVLIAANTLYGEGEVLTFEDNGNMVIHNNIIHSLTPVWPFVLRENGDDGYGYHIISNNTILNSEGHFALGIGNHAADPQKLIIQNNIVDGGGSFLNNTISHNLYTGLSWIQRNAGWHLSTGEIIETDLSKIFVDATNLNLCLLSTSPARDAGIDVSALLPTEIRNQFPEYDFTLDIVGNRRGSGGHWDMGAYEYVSGLTITSPNGSEVWRKGEQRTITWNANGVSGDLVIELLQNGQLVGVITSSVAASDGTFSWTVGRLANGQFITGPNLKIRIHTASGLVLGEKKIQ